MKASGEFDVTLNPQDDGAHNAGRMLIDKKYSGSLVGIGAGQMVSKRVDGGTSVYYAVEEFSGSVDGKAGSFTLLHHGEMNRTSQSLDIRILEGTGSGELASISGSLDIQQQGGKHFYTLTYDL